MICPHCEKPIRLEKSEETKKEALSLLSKGYSTRDVEALMKRAASYSTIARWAREIKKVPNEK